MEQLDSSEGGDSVSEIQGASSRSVTSLESNTVEGQPAALRCEKSFSTVKGGYHECCGLQAILCAGMIS